MRAGSRRQPAADVRPLGVYHYTPKQRGDSLGGWFVTAGAVSARVEATITTRTRRSRAS